MIIDGKKEAAILREEIKNEIAQLKKKTNKVPGLTVILIGEFAPSQIYVRNKEKNSKEVGINSNVIKYPSNVSEEEVLNKIEELNKDKNISGLSFEGEGCAISLASASILTDTLKGRDLQFSKRVTDDFLNMLKNKSKITLNSLSEDQITTITSLSGVQEFPMRVKCATMAWHTLLSAIEKK